MADVTATAVRRLCPHCKESYPWKETHVCKTGPNAGQTYLPSAEAQAVVPESSQSTDEDPLVGAVLGERYQIESFLSSGGMGVVYKARHVVLGKPVAIKLLRESQDEQAQQRFLLEAKSACHIGHEHIVDITDFGVLEDGRPYLVMEFLQGQSLEAVIAKGALPAIRVCRIGEQIARGLQAVHEKGILHRDLKPGNIFLLDRGRKDFVKILDFGIAKVMAGTRDTLAGGSEPLVNVRQTTQGTVLGTPEYLSPEQASGEAIDARVDQYALGCILYEMLTGVVPFKGNGPMSTLMKHLTERAVPPRKRRPDLSISESLEQTVLRAMARDKNERFASMEDLAQALSMEFEQSGIASTDTSITPLMINPSWSGIMAADRLGKSDDATRRLSTSGERSLRAKWVRRAIIAAGTLLLVGVVMLTVALRAQQKRKQAPADMGAGAVVKNTPPVDMAPVAQPPEPDKKPDAEGTDPHKGAKAELRVTLLNASSVAVTVACTGQRPCALAAGKSCLVRLPNDTGRCDATSPGCKPAQYTFAALRKTTKNGKLKFKVHLEPLRFTISKSK